jgi:hypothetical protein
METAGWIQRRKSPTAICGNCRAQSAEESANGYLQQPQGAISGGKHNVYLRRRKTASLNFKTPESKQTNEENK